MGNKRRFFVLDLLRGLVVLVMILAHSVFFFHNSTSTSLAGLEGFGNSVAFTTFLLISGAVFYVAYLKEDNLEKSRIKIKKRLLVLLLSYYVVAFFIQAGHLLTTYGFERWYVLWDILSFRLMPSFTEYIPPFIFFSFIVFIAPGFFKKLSQNVFKSFGIALALYLAGYLLYLSPTYEYLIPWKAFLSGADGYFRFPVLHYFPVFILGLYWGNSLFHTTSQKQKISIARTLGIFSLVSVAVITVVASYYSSLDIIFLRWPPTIPFIMLGLVFSFVTAFLFYKLKLFRKIPILRDGLLVFGQNAFAIFWAHIFLLQLYQMSGGTKVGSIPVFFFLFFLIITFSLALAAFLPLNFKFSLTFHKHSKEEEDEILERDPAYRFSEEIAEEAEKEIGMLKKFFFPKPDGTEKRQKLIRKRHIIGISVIFIILSFAVFPSVIQERDKRVKSALAESWWSDEYSYHIPVNIQNGESFSSITKGQVLEVSFDHQTLVASGKSDIRGNDIRVVYWDGRKFVELDAYLINGWNQTDTTLAFKVNESIPSGGEHEVSLYYGNVVAERSIEKKSDIKEWEYKYTITLKEEIAYPIILAVDRLWSLDSDQELGLVINTEKEFVTPTAQYRIIKKNLKGRLGLSEKGYIEGVADIEKLDPGAYQIQAAIEDGGEIQYSQKAGFYITDPLYVTWTIDWEGYDASNSYIDAMARIADRYGIPMTHLFSPRIYTAPEISAARQDYMTNWVKERERKGEEIGLHLHMQYDFVKDAGLQPKTDPNWGGKGDGYAVLTSAYSESEMTQILKRALEWFSAKGLEKPVSYRAGGWFANEDTLKALDNVGIKIDSSGRTANTFGKNNVAGHWDLTPTTAPYHPSTTDQNTSGVNVLNLWEVSNNGADSFWYKTADMTARFDQNYSGGILDSEKQVTYLTHPHWFHKIEQDNIEGVFRYIENFKYDNDKGPVIYATLEDIYNEWLSKM